MLTSLSSIVCLMMLCIACVAEALSATGPDCFVLCATDGDSLALVLQQPGVMLFTVMGATVTICVGVISSM